jgi:hypothetical protein
MDCFVLYSFFLLIRTYHEILCNMLFLVFEVVWLLKERLLDVSWSGEANISTTTVEVMSCSKKSPWKF